MTQDAADHPIIAIGGSAGGIGAVQDLLEALPGPLAAPIIIALHSVPDSRLTEILGKSCDIEITKIQGGETPLPGRIYVVPGGRHAYIRGGVMQISDEVTDSGFRPSIDMLLMTLAAEYGSRSIAVILSGMLKDGMRGTQVVYDMGGRTVVQNPDEAVYESMPQSVIQADHPNAILEAAELGAWLVKEAGLLA